MAPATRKGIHAQHLTAHSGFFRNRGEASRGVPEWQPPKGAKDRSPPRSRAFGDPVRIAPRASAASEGHMKAREPSTSRCRLRAH